MNLSCKAAEKQLGRLFNILDVVFQTFEPKCFVTGIHYRDAIGLPTKNV